MNIIYYGEINLFCIILLILFRTQLYHKRERFSVSDKVFINMIWATVLLCVSDFAAAVCRGKFFPGAHIVIEILNLIYFESMTLVAFLWLIYVFLKLKIAIRTDKQILIWSIPLIAFTVIALLNPFTNFLFFIDENNLYVRNSGIIFHWLITYSYLAVATIQPIRIIAKEKYAHKRKEIRPLLCFIVAPLIASITQMLFYGITSTQVGITVSIVIYSLLETRNQIFIDNLTDLNNRNGFDRYTEKVLIHHSEEEIFILMMDLNNFKQTNDRFGHIVGDRALSDAADALNRACAKMPEKLFLCRYGGDEFLILGCNCTENDIAYLKELIREELELKNRSNESAYKLDLSTGIARGKCNNFNDIESLIYIADKSMYDEKKRLKSKV